MCTCADLFSSTLFLPDIYFSLVLWKHNVTWRTACNMILRQSLMNKELGKTGQTWNVLANEDSAGSRCKVILNWVRTLWYRPWYQFPHIKPSVYGVKTKTLIPCLLSGFLAPESTIPMETDTIKDKHLDYLLPQRDTGWWESCWPARSWAPSSLQVVSRPKTGWWESSDQQGHVFPLPYLKPQIKTLPFSFLGSLGFQH